MNFRERQKDFDLFLSLMIIIVIVFLILVIGLFGLICSKVLAHGGTLATAIFALCK